MTDRDNVEVGSVRAPGVTPLAVVSRHLPHGTCAGKWFSPTPPAMPSATDAAVAKLDELFSPGDGLSLPQAWPCVNNQSPLGSQASSVASLADVTRSIFSMVGDCESLWWVSHSSVTPRSANNPVLVTSPSLPVVVSFDGSIGSTPGLGCGQRGLTAPHRAPVGAYCTTPSCFPARLACCTECEGRCAASTNGTHTFRDSVPAACPRPYGRDELSITTPCITLLYPTYPLYPALPPPRCHTIHAQPCPTMPDHTAPYPTLSHPTLHSQ